MDRYSNNIHVGIGHEAKKKYQRVLHLALGVPIGAPRTVNFLLDYLVS